MNFRYLWTAAFTSALLLTTLVACSSTTEPSDFVEEELAEPTEPEPPAFETLRDQAEEAFQERREREYAEEAIALWTQALADDSADEQSPGEIAEVYEHLAYAHYFVARFHESDGPSLSADSDVSTHADNGVEAASEALRIQAPEFLRAVERGAPFEAQLPEAPPEAVETLLWYAKNMDIKARTEGVSQSVATTPVVEAIMDFVVDTEPDAHFGAAHRFFGTHWIERPFHRDPEASAHAFADARDLAPDFVLTDILEAHHLAEAQGDTERSEELLNEALDKKGDATTELSPEDRIALQWAAELMKTQDE